MAAAHPDAAPRPSPAKALLVVVVLFGLLLGAFLIAGVLLTWGLLLLPVLAAGSVLYLVFSTRRPPPSRPGPDAVPAPPPRVPPPAVPPPVPPPV
jgi:hypothetical protein